MQVHSENEEGKKVLKPAKTFSLLTSHFYSGHLIINALTDIYGQPEEHLYQQDVIQPQ
jgi:hypothetical protein